jgi:hypothetical protein
MLMKRKTIALMLLPVLLAGCTSITNLTPRQHVRNKDGLYLFEAAWSSRQQSIVKESLKPYVVIGLDYYPMEPTPLVSNRWETLVPVPANQKFVNYRYKFDFDYLAIPVRRQDSRLSEPYTLEIRDK